MDIDRIYQQINHQLSRMRVSDTNKRDDLRQEIICEILRLHPEHDDSRSSFETYCESIILKHIANVKSRSRWKKHRDHERIDDLEFDEIPLTNDGRLHELDDIQRRVYDMELHEVIARMPNRLRQCCEYLQKYSPAETADKLGISNSTVHRMIQKIEDILDRSGFAPEE